MARVVLFDIGECLLNTDREQAALAEVHRTVLDSNGFEIDADEYAALDRQMILTFVPSPMHAITWHFAKPDVDLFDAMTREIRSHYPAIRKHTSSLYPGADTLLADLCQSHILGLAANAPSSIRDKLSQLGVLKYFTHTKVSGDLGVKKPDIQFFERILAEIDIEPDKVVLVGDRLDNDMIPAKRIGMGTIWIRRGRYEVLEPRVPDEIPDAVVGQLVDVETALYAFED